VRAFYLRLLSLFFLQKTDAERREDTQGIGAVSNVLECFGCIPASDILQNFFTTRVIIYKFTDVVYLFMYDHVVIVLVTVCCDLRISKCFGHGAVRSLKASASHLLRV